MYRFASTFANHGDISWIPPIIRRYLENMTLWHRIVTFIIRKKRFKNNWYIDLEKLCQEIKRTGLIDKANPENSYINSIIKDACQVLMSYTKRQLQCDIKSSPKLRTYILCKSVWQTEYLFLNLTRRQCSLMAQLRFDIMRIRIETGRSGSKPLKPDEAVFIRTRNRTAF